MPLASALAAQTDGGGITAWVLAIMEVLGGPGAGLAVALENLFPPIPSELILPLAGFAASAGSMSLLGAILWTTTGSVVGAIALYYVGALLGPERTRAIAVKLPLVDATDLDRTEDWFTRHGTKAVFLGRMVPVFRSFISVPAGVKRMPMPVFVAFTAAGSLIWNTLLVLAGYFLGANWGVVESYVGVFQTFVIIAVVVAVTTFVARRLRRRRVDA
ncbi:DedA family protein [Allosaccharopolyspora coralli]|uniref:DedA family protein n=1 Tax=Allosaccharopolyspora coralli TaxID=2665642 RepID=A0A5Q3QIY8_9PSEU|nr:DedA family protein [Allosaccharopolyspora coralli]QGK70807.1 DedA family protein [Allosaccharopolyspora coralli]